MTCAGWLFAGLKVRLIGLIHGVLMLVMGGYLLSLCLPFFLNPPGMVDNAAAGLIALTNFVAAIIGVVTFTSGVAIISLILSLRADGNGTQKPQ